MLLFCGYNLSCPLKHTGVGVEGDLLTLILEKSTLFDCSNNSSAIDLKVDWSALKARFFKMLGFAFIYIVSTAKTDAKKNGVLIP